MRIAEIYFLKKNEQKIFSHNIKENFLHTRIKSLLNSNVYFLLVKKN